VLWARREGLLQSDLEGEGQHLSHGEAVSDSIHWGAIK